MKKYMYKMISLFLVLTIFSSSFIQASSLDNIPDGYFSKHANMSDTFSLRKGYQERVKYLQILLQAEGSLNISSKNVDGKWGPITKAAVKKFQQKNNSTVDGKVGPNTKKLLDQVLSELKNKNNPPSPSKVSLKSPGKTNSSGVEISNKRPILKWDSDPVAKYYYIELKDLTSGTLNLNNKKVIVNFSSLYSSYQLNFDLQSGHKYSWKVKSCNSSECSGWSDSFYFKIKNEENNTYEQDLMIKSSEVIIKDSSGDGLYSVDEKVIVKLPYIYNIGNKDSTRYKLSIEYKSPNTKFRIIREEDYFNLFVKKNNKKDTFGFSGQFNLDKVGGKHIIKVCVIPDNLNDPVENNCIIEKITVYGDSSNFCQDADYTLLGRGFALEDIPVAYNDQTNDTNLNIHKAEAVLSKDIYTQKKENICGKVIYSSYVDDEYAQLIDYKSTSSGLNVGLYKLNDRYILAFGGTLSDRGGKGDYWDDVFADLLLLSKGYVSKQVIDADKYVENLLKTKHFSINKNNLTITGHSLGGALAQYISVKYGFEAVTFNTAPFPSNMDGLTVYEAKAEIKNFMANDDPLTMTLKVTEEVALEQYNTKNQENLQKITKKYLKQLDTYIDEHPFESRKRYILYIAGKQVVQFMAHVDKDELESAITSWLGGYFYGEDSFFEHAKKAYGYSDNILLKKLIAGNNYNRMVFQTNSNHGIEEFIDATFGIDENFTKQLIEKINQKIDGNAPKEAFIIKVNGRANKYERSLYSNKALRSIAEQKIIYQSNTLTPVLQFSAFQDEDGDKHVATWFDVRRNDDKKYLYDSGWMSGAITQNTVPVGYLEYNTLYRVRVVYKDFQGKLSNIKISYFKVLKAPKPKIKSIEIPNIGQTGAFVIAKVDTHNEDGIKAYIEWSSNDTNTWQSKPIAIKKDQDIFYHKLNNLQCNTTYTYRAYVENNRSGKDYTPFKTFKTLPCAPLVKIATKSDTTGLVSFGNVDINKCASKIVTVTKMNDIGVAHGKVGFSDLSGNDTNEFYVIDGEYTLHNKGDKKDIEVEYCPNKEAEHSLLLTANDGKYTMEKYSQGLLITGEAVDKGNTTFSGDFYLTNASLSKTTVKVGETFKAHVTQHYSGNINKSQKVYLGYFLSKDKIWDKDDDPLDYDYSSLDKNDIEDEEGETLKITEKGDYYILFVSDYRKKYNETDESNNVKYIKIKVESPSAIDTDNDGITDTDEAKYGLNPNDPSDAIQDNDGDGVSNIDEITAGTDPTDANSHPNQTKTKITLKKGWNLFGANTLVSLQSFKADIGIDNLLILQGASKTYKKEYIDNGTNFLNDFTKMEIGKGYWVKLALDAEFEYTPMAVENATIELNSGWNLINPTKELTISEIKSQIGTDNLLIIQGENKTYKKEYVDDGTEFLNDFNKFEEPKGYWIKLQNSSRLTQ